MTILSVAAGMDAYLRADHGIRMVNDYGMNMGYVFAGRNINLFTPSGEMQGVRVMDNGNIVTIAPGTFKLERVGGDLVITTNEQYWNRVLNGFNRMYQKVRRWGR